MDNKFDELLIDYNNLSLAIKTRLNEFKQVPEDKYFYEMVYCLCTPMSKATNALKVQEILQSLNYLNNPIDITDILRNPKNYIRFHNQKAKFIEYNKKQYDRIHKVIKKDIEPAEKRNELVEFVKGFGYKEASHFLRNIGIFDLAILDRHILKNLVKFEIIPNNYKLKNYKDYINIETYFVNFAKMLKIEIEELDLLLWARETGEVLK
ncbi:MAG: DNA lyase [Candidatus Kapaibacteriota bacterium]